MRLIRRALVRSRNSFYRFKYRRTTSFGTASYIAGRLQITGPGSVIIGARVFFADHAGATRIHTEEGVTVRIGDGCYVNGLSIAAYADVTIGPDCLLGDAHLLTTNYHSVGRDRHSLGAQVKVAPITLGRNVWLAGQAVILPGVSVGDDSVVAIRSVISKDVGESVVVTSHRQRVVREL